MARLLICYQSSCALIYLSHFLPQISDTCCWASYVFHHLFGNPRNPQGNFVQRLGAPSPPEVQLLRQVQRDEKKTPNTEVVCFPSTSNPSKTVHFVQLFFLGAIFGGGCPKDSDFCLGCFLFREGLRIGSGFRVRLSKSNCIGQSLPYC